MQRFVFTMAVLGVLGQSSPALAGVWFDIGSPDTTYVLANQDAASWERYPPLPFGPYPVGTLVYEDVAAMACEALRNPSQICGSSKFIRGFQVYFSDGGCGCGGFLAKPTTVRLQYDPAVVAAAGATEAELRLLFSDDLNSSWAVAEGAVVKAAGHYVEVPWSRNVLGNRQFAIVTLAVTPTLPSTWGRLKANYR